MTHTLVLHLWVLWRSGGREGEGVVVGGMGFGYWRLWLTACVGVFF